MSRNKFVFKYEYHNYLSCSLEVKVLSSSHLNTMKFNIWRKLQL